METALLLIGGFAFLYFGGEYLVRGAVGLANHFGVSAMLIGLVVVGFGTSAPELVVAVDAAIHDSPALAIGNVLGSNVSNILLILGVGAVITPILCERRVVFRDGLFMLFATVLVVGLAFTELIDRWQGAGMVGLLACFLVWTYRQERKESVAVGGSVPPGSGDDDDVTPFPKLWMNTVAAGASILALVVGAELFVSGAQDLARLLGVSEAVIALSIVAIGTSLPELSITVVSALRGRADVAVGNVLGSNVFNLLSVLGITALVAPLPVDARFLEIDVWVMLGASVLLLPLLFTRGRLSRGEGILFLGLYALYIWTMVPSDGLIS